MKISTKIMFLGALIALLLNSWIVCSAEQEFVDTIPEPMKSFWKMVWDWTTSRYPITKGIEDCVQYWHVPCTDIHVFYVNYDISENISDYYNVTLQKYWDDVDGSAAFSESNNPKKSLYIETKLLNGEPRVRKFYITGFKPAEYIGWGVTPYEFTDSLPEPIKTYWLKVWEFMTEDSPRMNDIVWDGVEYHYDPDNPYNVVVFYGFYNWSEDYLPGGHAAPVDEATHQSFLFDILYFIDEDRILINQFYAGGFRKVETPPEFVIPEGPLGTIAGITMMLSGLALYVKFFKKIPRPKITPSVRTKMAIFN